MMMMLKLLQVFLHRGELHIVSRAQLSSVDAVCDAVDCVRNTHTATVAAALIQQAILHRISGY